MRIGEQLHDLGAAGLLGLAHDSLGSWQPPFPAQAYGRAKLHVDGEVHHRLEACTRPLSRAAIESVILKSRARLARAVASVRAQIDQVAAFAKVDRS